MSADISGKEQPFLGVRVVGTTYSNEQIGEEFLGFLALDQIDAAFIAKTNINLKNFEVGLDHFIRERYDRSSTITEKESGEQAKTKSKYPKLHSYTAILTN